jgi:hypothetical protein
MYVDEHVCLSVCLYVCAQVASLYLCVDNQEVHTHTHGCVHVFIQVASRIVLFDMYVHVGMYGYGNV